MPLEIRSLLPADLPAVSHIATQFDHNAWSEAVFADCLKAGYCGFVLEKDHQNMIGFLIGLIHGSECQLMNIGIVPAHWHKGYGSQLLKHLITFLKKCKVLHIVLEVRCSNKAAICLYESHGFKQVGVRRNYYPTDGQEREDAWVYMLEMTP